MRLEHVFTDSPILFIPKAACRRSSLRRAEDLAGQNRRDLNRARDTIRDLETELSRLQEKNRALKNAMNTQSTARTNMMSP